MLDKYITWFKAHERLLLVALVLLVGHYGVKHYLDNAASADKTKVDVAVAALASQKAVDVQLAAQTAQATAQYQTIVQALSVQNVALAKAVTERSAGLQQQRQIDSQLPVSGLAERIQALALMPPGSISITPTSVVLTQPGALSVASALESIPVLTQDVKDETQIADNRQLEVEKANSVVSSLTAQVSGLTLAGVDADKACKAEVASVKADARKSKLSWFKRGLVVGFIGGLFVGHAAL